MKLSRHDPQKEIRQDAGQYFLTRHNVEKIQIFFQVNLETTRRSRVDPIWQNLTRLTPGSTNDKRPLKLLHRLHVQFLQDMLLLMWWLCRDLNGHNWKYGFAPIATLSGESQNCSKNNFDKITKCSRLCQCIGPSVLDSKSQSKVYVDSHKGLPMMDHWQSESFRLHKSLKECLSYMLQIWLENQSMAWKLNDVELRIN